MPMKAPPHPGLLVRDNLEELGLSVATAARLLGVTRQQLYNVIAGRSAVSPDMALRFERGFGGSAEFWLKLQSQHDLAISREKLADTRIERLVPAGG